MLIVKFKEHVRFPLSYRLSASLPSTGVKKVYLILVARQREREKISEK